jgi:hypothetical protein
MAHNMKAYDGYFLLQYLVENILPHQQLPQIVMNGAKILCITFNKVKIIDSFSFIPMALSKFPKTFGLLELKKGYFPFQFNTLENQTYIGKLPDKRLFGIDQLKLESINDFEIWYDKTKDRIFDLQREMKEYCQSDVDILTRGALAFRHLFMLLTKSPFETNGIDPFRRSLTIASACHLVYRTIFMPE